MNQAGMLELHREYGISAGRLSALFDRASTNFSTIAADVDGYRVFDRVKRCLRDDGRHGTDQTAAALAVVQTNCATEYRARQGDGRDIVVTIPAYARARSGVGFSDFILSPAVDVRWRHGPKIGSIRAAERVTNGDLKLWARIDADDIAAAVIYGEVGASPSVRANHAAGSDYTTGLVLEVSLTPAPDMPGTTVELGTPTGAQLRAWADAHPDLSVPARSLSAAERAAERLAGVLYRSGPTVPRQAAMPPGALPVSTAADGTVTAWTTPEQIQRAELAFIQ